MSQHPGKSLIQHTIRIIAKSQKVSVDAEQHPIPNSSLSQRSTRN